MIAAIDARTGEGGAEWAVLTALRMMLIVHGVIAIATARARGQVRRAVSTARARTRAGLPRAEHSGAEELMAEVIKRYSSGPSRLNDGRYQILLNTPDLPAAWVTRFKEAAARAEVADLRIELSGSAITYASSGDHHKDIPRLDDLLRAVGQP